MLIKYAAKKEMPTLRDCNNTENHLDKLEK